MSMPAESLLYRTTVPVAEQSSQSYQAPQGNLPKTFDPLALMALPFGYENMIESMLAAREEGQVFPYFVPQVLLVPSGTTSQVITSIPPGETAAVVYLLKLRADTYSTEFLVTFQADDLPPLFVESPLNYPLDIRGSFLPPARTRGVYTLVNNDTIDITFTATIQLAVMNSNFARNVYEPLVKGQYRAIRQLAEQFSVYNQGGGAI